VGLYRARFNIPIAWRNRPILLNLYSFDRPIAFDKANFYVNGKLAATYKTRGWSQTFNYDVTSLIQPGGNEIAVHVDGGQEFSGLSGCVWLSPQRSLSPTKDLAGPWTVVGADFKPKSTFNVPGQTDGRYLATSLAIPESWRGNSVYVRFKTADLWVGSVVINGIPIAYNEYLHPFGTISDINLTPYVKYGANNRLEIWPHWTTSVPASGHATTRMQLDQVQVGCSVQAMESHQ